ncbi:DAZ interacting zinc finger protein 1 [Haematobia irritans]|uniref:DAZ interacting zinc finger protein 1 n=1 Tax=Haematobia irritans TaxID=7368 RepID=UPI003F50CD03
MSFAFKYNYPQVARESGFQLRNFKDGPLDWRLIGTVEIERVLREQCLEQLDSVLPHLSEAPLGSILENKVLDGGIAKYFLLSQFSIQYLLFCRKFLEETIEDLRESHGAAQMEVATLKRSLSEANNEILQLHKKITHMEAIHEVIYPCTFCTKNFVSNDALNLHISRKHSVNVRHEGSETPSTKDRGNDLNLINTIKLELEIKQLKERLNNAEIKIRDGLKVPTSLQSNRSDFEQEEKRRSSTVSIGIQSNLTEIKEQDDKNENVSSHECHYLGQVSELQDKLVDLNQWKEEQKAQNAQFLIEISKLFTTVVECQELQQKRVENELITPSPSMDHLDALLSKKIEEIGETTTAKLSDVMSKLELSYKHKLEELEKTLIKTGHQNVPKEESNKIMVTPKKENLLKVKPEDEEKVEQEVMGESKSKTEKEITKVENPQMPVKQVQSLKIPPENSCESISEDESSILSNQTFVKSKSDNLNKSKEYSTEQSEESAEEDNKDLPTKEHEKRNIKAKSHARPKSVTRSESKKMVNSRLVALGISPKLTHLSNSSLKTISHELNERRHKTKEKHPNFYATRNKIKKFVDKLCSSKMPENAQALLRATRPIKQQDHSVKHTVLSSSDEEESNLGGSQNKTSTPIKETHSFHNTQFKQRLERILASPIRKPDEQTKAIIHKQNEPLEQRYPIPMPRTKRVMFNQPEKKTNDIFSASESENEPNFR